MTAVGELITPTGVLVMDAEAMAGDRETWLKARRWRRPRAHGVWTEGLNIGSSDVPSILDLDGVGTPVHVFRNKVMGVKMPVTEQMEMGHEAEPFIANRWTRVNQCVTDEIGLVARQDAPWHVSTIDRRVRECPEIKGLTDGCGLEVKNVGYSSASRWNRELPDRILAQVLHQLYVTGYDHMHVALWIGGNQPKQAIVRPEREQQLMDYVVGEVDRFRERHLIPGVEPAWSDSKVDKLLALDKATHPIRAGEASVEELGYLLEYAQAQAEEAAAGKRKKRAQAQMARIADGVQMVLFGDQPAWSYREGETTRVTAAGIERLKEKYPDAYDDPEIVERKTTYTLVVDKAYKVKISEKGSDR